MKPPHAFHDVGFYWILGVLVIAALGVAAWFGWLP